MLVFEFQFKCYSLKVNVVCIKSVLKSLCDKLKSPSIIRNGKNGKSNKRESDERKGMRSQRQENKKTGKVKRRESNDGTAYQ